MLEIDQVYCTNIATTIYSIVSIFEKVQKFSDIIVDFHRSFECCPWDLFNSLHIHVDLKSLFSQFFLKGRGKKGVRSLNLTNKYERKMKCQNQRSDPFLLNLLDFTITKYDICICIIFQIGILYCRLLRCLK